MEVFKLLSTTQCPQKGVVKGIVVCLALMTATYRPCAAAIQLNGIIRYPQRTKVQIMCTFPGQPYRGMTVTIRRRISQNSKMCRLSMTTCTESINFYMLGPSSVTGFTSDGSVVYTLYRASCRDTGEYMCETVYSTLASVKNGGIVTDEDFLEMHVGSSYMDARPEKIPAANLLASTQMIINCSVFTTINLQESFWVWQTRLTANDSWRIIPKASWNMTGIPSPNSHCHSSWTSSLVALVRKADLGREYRCYVAYPHKERYYQSKPGIYMIEAAQPLPMSPSARRALYVILIVAFVAALFVLGVVVVVIARSTDLTQVDRWMSSLRHRCCLRYLLGHRRRRHSSEHRGGGEQPQDSPEVIPSSGGVVGAAGEAAAGIFSPRAGLRQAGQKDQKNTTSPEDDAPGAEDDALEFHFLSNDGPAYLSNPLRVTVSQTTYVMVGKTERPSSPTLQEGVAPGKADSCVALDDVMTTSVDVISSRESYAVLNEAAKSDISVGSGVDLTGTPKPEMKSMESSAPLKELVKPDVKSSHNEWPEVTAMGCPRFDAVSATSTQKTKQGNVRDGRPRLACSPSYLITEPHLSPAVPRAPSLLSLPSLPLTCAESERLDVGSVSATDKAKPSCSSTSKMTSGKTQHLLSKISTTTVTLRKTSEETTAPVKAEISDVSEEHKCEANSSP